MEEEILYKAIFPEDNDPNHVNYGYFVGKNKKSLYNLKTLISESQLNPILIKDEDRNNAFFAKVFQYEVDDFLHIVDQLKFKEIRLPTSSMDDVRYLFEFDTRYISKKVIFL